MELIESHSNLHEAEVLIVDDQPANVTLLTAVLSEHGCTVRSAINGRSALTEAHESPPDLILLDIRMPDIDGFQVCE